MWYYIPLVVNWQEVRDAGYFFISYREGAMKNGVVVKESNELIIGKKYIAFREETFTIEPCVGGMSSGVQTKWRIRQMDNDGKEKVLVVMNGVLFSVSNRYFFIEHNVGKVENRLEGYAVYAI
jgi:hypothetical protein